MMTVLDVLGQCTDFRVYERRSLRMEYGELVFYNEDMDAWQGMLVKTLDAPVKPVGDFPTKQDLSLTAPYGGIYDNQTLFKKEFEGGTLIAMLWPWQDRTHTTLKMIFLKKD